MKQMSVQIGYYMASPQHYTMLGEIPSYLPELTIICDSPVCQEYLKGKAIPYLATEEIIPPLLVIFPDFYQVLAKKYRAFYTNPNIKKVHIFHSLAEKHYSLSPYWNNGYHLVLAPGKYAAGKLAAAGLTNWEIVGYPRLDPLINGRYDRSATLRRLGLDPEHQTILYAPTCSNGNLSSLPHIGERIMEAIPTGCNLLVKLHDRTEAQWTELYNSLPGVVLVDDPDARPYLEASDVLVSDASGIIFEFTALDKPVVLFETGIYDPDGIESKWRDIGLQASSIEEVGAAVSRSLVDPGEKRAQRLHYNGQLFCSLDGLSSARAAAAIRHLLELKSAPPFNYDACILNHNLPPLLRPGISYPCHITVMNTGANSWTEAGDYRLGRTGGLDINGELRCCLAAGEKIALGQVHIFGCSIRTPPEPGTYHLCWSMVRDGILWFGEKKEVNLVIGV